MPVQMESKRDGNFLLLLVGKYIMKMFRQVNEVNELNEMVVNESNAYVRGVERRQRKKNVNIFCRRINVTLMPQLEMCHCNVKC